MKTVFWILIGGIAGYQCNNCERGREDLSHIGVYGGAPVIQAPTVPTIRVPKLKGEQDI